MTIQRLWVEWAIAKLSSKLLAANDLDSDHKSFIYKPLESKTPFMLGLPEGSRAKRCLGSGPYSAHSHQTVPRVSP